jgi:hypothetical protein
MKIASITIAYYWRNIQEKLPNWIVCMHVISTVDLAEVASALVLERVVGKKLSPMVIFFPLNENRSCNSNVRSGLFKAIK